MRHKWRKATAYANELNLAKRVKFEQTNYLNTGYPAESFDLVWAIESVCYANNKKEFLQEAFRLLKKGGRLIVADFFKANHLKKRWRSDKSVG